MGTFRTSFKLYGKEGTWKDCILYEGRFSYASGYEYAKISDLSQRGTALSTTYATLGVNEQDIINFEGGYMGNDHKGVYFVGKGRSSPEVKYTHAPSGIAPQEYYAACLGGSVYWWKDGNKTIFARINGDSKNNGISNDVIAEFELPAGYYFLPLHRYNAGITVPLRAYNGSSNQAAFYLLNTATGTVENVGTITAGTTNCNSLVLDDGTEYHFLWNGSSKWLARFKDGVSTITSLSISGTYSNAALYYDKTAQKLVLYLGNVTASGTSRTFATKGYQLDPDTYAETELTLPTALTIDVDSSGDSGYGNRDTAQAVALLNGTSSTQTSYGKNTYDGKICLDNPVTPFNYAYFDANTGKRTPQQFLFLHGWSGYNYYSEPHRVAYIDNLYYETSANNIVYVRATQG